MPGSLFDHLTPEERERLLGLGRVAVFAAGDALSADPRRMAVLLSGRAAVREGGVLITTLGTGAVLDDHAAVIEATGPVECLEVDPAALPPELAAALFAARTALLSAELRDAHERLAPLMLAEVAQAVPARMRRSPPHRADDLPPSLTSAVYGFKAAMAEAEMALRDGAADAAVQPLVSQACDALSFALAEHVNVYREAEPAIGTYVQRATFGLLMTSNVVERMYTKPRGFTGEFGASELIYENSAKGQGALGPLIDRWALDCRFARAIRGRRPYMVRSIAAAGRGARVLSLGCGAAPELFDALAADPGGFTAVAVDVDPQALACVSAKATAMGAAGRIQPARQNVLRLIAGKGSLDLPPQGLIYAFGFAEYLRPQQVVALLDWAWEQLAPGGRMVLGNFAEGQPDRAFMEHVCEWYQNHRSRDELLELFARSRFGAADEAVAVSHDASGTQFFAVASKD